MLSGVAGMECCDILEEPRHYSVFRAASAQGFATGQMPEIAESDKRQLTQEEYAATHMMMWKNFCRQAAACIALCLEALGESGTMTEQDLASARKNRDDAIKCELLRAYSPTGAAD